MALHDVLSILADDPETALPVRRALAAASTRLAAGVPLSAALRDAMPGLPTATLQWLQEAEATGADATALDTLAADLANIDEARRTRRLALAWPTTMALCIAALWLLMAVFVVPSFQAVYADFGADLPEPTRALFGFASAAQGSWWWWLPLLVLLAAVLWFQRRRVLPWVQTAAEEMPAVRRLAQARFARRLLALLLGHADSVPLQVAALAHLAATAPTRRWSGVAARVQAARAGGQALGLALLTEAALPRRLALHLQIGEKLGDVPTVLAQLQNANEADCRDALARFERHTLLLMYGVLGTVAGALVVAIYLPIFKLGSIF